jgi:hypothetical protein
MALPPDLAWIEVDLPRMIEYKSEILRDEKPVCALERVALDLADSETRRTFLRRIGERRRTTLVLTEGLLIYLESGQVAALATDLGGSPAFKWWVTDLASPVCEDDGRPEVPRSHAPVLLPLRPRRTCSSALRLACSRGALELPRREARRRLPGSYAPSRSWGRKGTLRAWSGQCCSRRVSGALPRVARRSAEQTAPGGVTDQLRAL